MSESFSYLVFLPLPYEVTTSFLQGTVHGPSAILGELESLDCFDFDLGRDPFRDVARSVIQPHNADLADPLLQQALTSRVVGELLESGGFPLCLGGEHTISIGPIRAARTRGPLGVVQLDAHADLRQTYEGSQFSHACVMRRVLEMDCPTMAVGIRTLAKEEADLVKAKNLRLVDGRRAAETNDWYGLVDELPERVYLTVDMDAFDPLEAPAVGTPEPGGPSFDAMSDFLRYVFKKKNVVGADIVELRPSPGDASTIRLAARIAGLITGLRFKK